MPLTEGVIDGGGQQSWPRSARAGTPTGPIWYMFQLVQNLPGSPARPETERLVPMSRLQVEAEETTTGRPRRGSGPWSPMPPGTRSGGRGRERLDERPGDSSEHGVGAVRRIRYRRTTTLERVVEVEEGRRLAYTVVKGIPVRNYRGLPRPVLTPTAGGTRVRWSAAWDGTLLGRIVHSRLRAFFPGWSPTWPRPPTGRPPRPTFPPRCTGSRHPASVSRGRGPRRGAPSWGLQQYVLEPVTAT